MRTNFQDWKYRTVEAANAAEAACVVCFSAVKGECFYCPSLGRLVHSACFFHGGGVCNRNSCVVRHLPITHYSFKVEHSDFLVQRVIVG